MLKPLAERSKCQVQHFWQSCSNVSADDVINRLRGKLAGRAWSHAVSAVVSRLDIGGRQSNAQYQYTLQGENLELNNWAPQLLAKMRRLQELRDVNTDQQDKGLQAQLVIDRDNRQSIGRGRGRTSTTPL